MKKILVVSEVFYPENFLINDLVLQWQKDGYKVDILTQHPSYPVGKIYSGYENQYYSTECWGTSTIHRFKFIEGYRESKLKKILNYITFIWIGTKIAKKIGKNYDHIFVHQTGPLTVALPAVAIKKMYNIPLTIWTLDIWPDAVYAYGFPRIIFLKWFLDYIIRKVYRNCDNILVSSKKFNEVINKYLPDKKIDYIPNWLIPGDDVKSGLRLNPDKLNFTFTGNISISQNLQNVIRGFTLANIDNAVLNIVGNGSKFEDLKKMVEREHLSNVFLHGQYPYNEMADILNQSDILVLSLIAQEGIEKTEPFKLQSYLKAQKPIIGIIRGSGREIINEENLGICADPSNIEDIALKFKQIITFADQNNKKIKYATKKLLETRFNRELIVDKIYSFIK